MRRLSIIIAVLLAATVAANAQQAAFRPKAGPGIAINNDGSISANAPFKDQSGGSYTIVQADNAFVLEVGSTATSTFTYTLPRAGSSAGQLPANWSILIINRGSANAAINTTTSIFRGAGETTGMILSPGASVLLQSDGTDWLSFLFNNHPIITDVSTNRTIGTFEGELGATVAFNSGSPIAVALSGTAVIGTCVTTIQAGTGQITFAPSGSGTRNQIDLFTRTAGQYAGMTWCVTSNTTGSNASWIGFGRGAP